jgi:hypothetical protein
VLDNEMELVAIMAAECRRLAEAEVAEHLQAAEAAGVEDSKQLVGTASWIR